MNTLNSLSKQFGAKQPLFGVDGEVCSKKYLTGPTLLEMSGYRDRSLPNSLAEIFLVWFRMSQTMQVDTPQTQFHRAKLKKTFDEVWYSFEKIVGEVRGDSELVIAKQAVNQLQISLNQFENLLKERGLSIDSYDSIKYLYQEIEHPLSELRRYFMKEPSEILTDRAGVVYVNALKASFRELIDIAEGMDNEHSSIPKSAL